MPPIESRIDSNRPTSLQATAPRAPDGGGRPGAASTRRTLPELEADEADRRFAAFEAELKPSGEVGLTLVRLAATLSVRIERCVEHENAVLTRRVRQALADLVVPEGADAAQVERLRCEAGRVAAFDPSDEATLARRYEAAAERGFFRALKELRLIERREKAEEVGLDGETLRGTLASLFQGEARAAAFEARYPELASPGPGKPAVVPAPAHPPTPGGRVDVPFTIGRRR